MAKRVQLICWKVEEARDTAAALRTAGYEVASDAFSKERGQALATNPPDAVVIDLNRQPMQGRDVALVLRTRKATRHVPLVFMGGEPEKVAKVQMSLPDAVYTTPGRLASAVKKAIANPPDEPIKPQSVLARYSGTPLPKKLGIKPNATVSLIDAPEDFEKTLGELPGGVAISRNSNATADLTLWFTTSRKNLERGIARMASRVGRDGLWIVWPKKAAAVASDVTQNNVRDIGLASGLVDYKVCAVDATWSGLKFARRKAVK
ncbi:MAG: hypothetical protein ACRD8O_23605 [Bryobacteraceae bacterium]